MLNHSKQCFEDTITYENSTRNTRYEKKTPYEELPGYLKALKREVDVREQSMQQYKSLLSSSTVRYETALNECSHPEQYHLHNRPT